VTDLPSWLPLLEVRLDGATADQLMEVPCQLLLLLLLLPNPFLQVLSLDTLVTIASSVAHVMLLLLMLLHVFSASAARVLTISPPISCCCAAAVAAATWAA
jgi:hypothetical protein